MASIIYQVIWKGFPLYELFGRETIARKNNITKDSSPQSGNTPGGVADRSNGADDQTLIELVLNSNKPAALLDGYMTIENIERDYIQQGMEKQIFKEYVLENFSQKCRQSEEAWEEAKKIGLSVLLLKEQYNEAEHIWPFVGKNVEHTKRAMVSLLYPARSLDFHIALGLALGYSKEDIRNFCYTIIKVWDSSLNPKVEFEAVYARCVDSYDTNKSPSGRA